MSTNKCCGNCKHFKDEDAEGFGFCIADKYVHHITGGGLCVVHQFKNNGWTEITPDNEEEVYNIPPERIVVSHVVNGLIYYSSYGDMYCSIATMAKHGGYYYYVLPELKIE